MIPVNKPYFPDLGKYQRYVEDIYGRASLTNNGPLVRELKARLEDYLGVQNLLPVANGTLALQVAYKALDITGNAITTPFTFVATSSSLKWEGISPQFADINPQSLNLCPKSTETLIDSETTAIVPVHVYGNPCAVDDFDELSLKYNLKVVYDAAHAFAIKRNGNSILNYGDASTLSFHATKVFHAVEGGAVIFKSKEAYERAEKMINFGIDKADGRIVDHGINAKLSEVHAAMGLCVLDDINDVIEHRCKLQSFYIDSLSDIAQFPVWDLGSNRNGAYIPVVFESHEEMLKVVEHLKNNHILARRYFSPSLDEVSIFNGANKTPIASDYANRVICLPLFADLNIEWARRVVDEVKKGLR